MGDAVGEQEKAWEQALRPADTKLFPNPEAKAERRNDQKTKGGAWEDHFVHYVIRKLQRAHPPKKPPRRPNLQTLLGRGRNARPSPKGVRGGRGRGGGQDANLLQDGRNGLGNGGAGGPAATGWHRTDHGGESGTGAGTGGME